MTTEETRIDASGDWADTLAHQILSAHCACYAEAWPAHTRANESAKVAEKIRSAFKERLATAVGETDRWREAATAAFAMSKCECGPEEACANLSRLRALLVRAGEALKPLVVGIVNGAAVRSARSIADEIEEALK